MKNRLYISKVTDSIIAIIQTIILVFVPIVFDGNLAYKVIAYIAVAICFIVYNIFLRNRIINGIVSRQAIDIDDIKKTNSVTVFYNCIIPEIRSVLCNNDSLDDFDLLCRFRVWKKAIYFISDHFWGNGKFNNVITSEQVSYSANSVYKNEVVTVAKKLLEVMTDNDISKAVEFYNCSTMKSDINKRLEIIKAMATIEKKNA